MEYCRAQAPLLRKGSVQVSQKTGLHRRLALSTVGVQAAEAMFCNLMYNTTHSPFKISWAVLNHMI
jgi:hypothetical protein